MSELRKAAPAALEALDGLSEDAVCQSSHHAKKDQHTSLDVCPVFLRLRAAATTLRTALAIPEPEPVQEPHQIRSDFEQRMIGVGASPTALSRLKSGEYLSPSIQSAWDAEKKKYTTPPQRKPLTKDEIELAYHEVWRSLPSDFSYTSYNWIEQGIRYAEQAHGII